MNSMGTPMNSMGTPMNDAETRMVATIDGFARKREVMAEVGPRVKELFRVRDAYVARLNQRRPIGKLKKRFSAILKEIRYVIYTKQVEWDVMGPDTDLAGLVATLEMFNNVYIAPADKMKQARELKQLAVEVKHSGKIEHEHGVRQVVLELPVQAERTAIDITPKGA